MKILIKLLLFILLNNTILQAMQLSESLRLDGYANASLLTTENQNNENKFEITGGFQTRYQITNDLSTTAQVYFEESKNSNSVKEYEADIKWLYLDYYIGGDTTIRGGMFQFPIFEASETGTIGYTTTWTENPLTRYGAFGYDDFNGLELLKKISYDDYDVSIQLSYGNSENELPTHGGDTINGEAEGLKGITVKTSNDWFKLNIGYIEATSDLTLPSGPSSSSTSTSADFYMYAFENQIALDNFSIKSGYIRSKLESIFPDEKRYYTSFEYNEDDFTPYIYYSNDQLIFKSDDNAPPGKTSRSNSTVEKYSIGTRYELNSNTALKVSYSYEKDTNIYDNDTTNEVEYNTLTGTVNVIF
ncbi:hypothetical protein N9W00_01065 [Arcobacteraceae bacterium]|nr:hypothetical protein [Arcobacteraceae bacterium]